jgi:hypothetical protein
VEEQALGIDHDVALLTLDQLARIEAVRIDARPPCMRLSLSRINGFDNRFPGCGSRDRAIA